VRAPGAELAPGQLHDANSTSLAAALTAAGADVFVRPCFSDDYDALADILDSDASSADLLVTIGAASKGTREVVRDVLSPLGVEFGEVAMQPGGPQGFGIVGVRDLEAAAANPDADPVGRPLPVVCLPGNPVSALVSFEMFLRPVLGRLAGRASGDRSAGQWQTGTLAQPATTPPTKDQLRRGRVDADGRLEFVGGPSSHLLHAYAQASVLIRLRHSIGSYAEGDRADYWRIDG
jgi:molybdopterin molybdotransferase